MEIINKTKINIKKIPMKNWIKIVLVAIFLMMLVLNILTPLIADDYSYSFIHGTDQRVKNIIDVISSQADHYMTWGGRSIAHSIAQIFLIFPKIIFSLCNSIVYTIVIYLIYKNTVNGEEKPMLLILIHFLLYFCLPVFGQNCLWLIGSCNYLWTTMFILLFILLYRSKRKDNLLTIVLIFFIGIIAGWSNENSSFALIVITSLIFMTTKKKKFEKWKISGLLGVITGFIIMIIAPGNFARNKYFVDNISFFTKIFNRAISYTSNIVRFMWPLIAVSIVLLSIHIYKKKSINKNVFIYLVGSFFAVYSMLLSPQFPERSWVSPILFMIMANIILINDLYDINKVFKYVFIDSLLILAVIYIGSYAELVGDINNLKNTWEYRISEINKVKDSDNKEIQFDPFYTENWKNPNFGLGDLTENKDDWPDKDIAKYYGIDSISSKTN